MNIFDKEEAHVDMKERGEKLRQVDENGIEDDFQLSFCAVSTLSLDLTRSLY